MLKVVAAVAILGFGTLLLHKNKLKKPTKEKKNEESDLPPDTPSRPILVKQQAHEEQDKKEESKAQSETVPISLMDWNQYLHPELHKEIWSIWRKTCLPLKITSVDLKSICGHILAFSIGLGLKDRLLHGSVCPGGMYLHKYHSLPRYKFACAIRLVEKNDGSFFEILLTMNDRYFLHKEEKQYLGKLRAYPLGTATVGFTNFVTWEINGKYPGPGICLQIVDKA